MRQWSTKRMISVMLVILLAVSCLGGCGRDGGQGDGGSDGQSAQTGSGPSSDQGGSGSEDVAEAERLFLQKVIPLSIEEPEEYTQRAFYYDTLGGKFYFLAAYDKEDSETAYVLNIFDGDTGETTGQSFAMESLGENTWIKSMDVLPDGSLSFRVADYVSGKDFLVRTDLEGNVTAREETFPQPESYPWNADIYSGERHRTFDLQDGMTVIGEADEENKKISFFQYDEKSGIKKAIGVMKEAWLSAMCKGGREYFLLYCRRQSVSVG